MKPLLNGEGRAGDGHRSRGGAGSSDAWALRLLEAAEHYQLNPARRQRVWMRLSHASARRSLPVRRMVMATGIVLGMVGGTAIASAALGRWPGWAVRAYERLAPWSVAPAPSSGSAHVAVAGRIHRSAHRSQSQVPVGALARQEPAPDSHAPEAPAPAVMPAAVTAPPSATAAGGSGEASRESGQHRESQVAAAHGPRRLSQVPSSEDDRPVLAAMRALRREKNPMRARALLRKYLADHPNGTLAEEALALSIEAAVAQGDTEAKVLAGRYLQIYPSGPFQSLAQHTLNVRQ